MNDISRNYVMIMGWMLTDLELSGTELLLYALIYGFTQDNATEFSGSLSYMMAWTGKSKRCVQDSINNLVEKNLIIKNTGAINGVLYCTYKANMGYSKNCHTLANSAIGGIANSAIGGIANSATNNTNKDNTNINNILPSSPYRVKESEYDEKFETFWKAYPRKENKKNSYKIWTKLDITDDILDKILKNIDYNTRYNEQWYNPKFIPMPSTYLNGKRWEDEVDNNNYSSTDNGGFETLDDYIKNNNCGLHEI